MKTYLINLANRTDRLESSRIQLSKVDSAFVRIEAVFISPNANEASTLVTNGVKGCWESHRKCFVEFLKTEEEFALICEDDLEITRLEAFYQAMNWGISNQVDLIQLGFLVQGIRNRVTYSIDALEQLAFKAIYKLSKISNTKFSSFNNKLRVRRYGLTSFKYVPDSFLPGTHCYIISRRMAQSVLSLNSPQFLSADDFFIALSKMRSFDMYRIRKSAVKQNNSVASIDDRFIGAK